MSNINDICDYIIFSLKAEGNTPLSNIKLQKLLYYTQAWYLAFYEKPLFEGNFQAWIHGPVNREIFNRFRDTKFLYSEINLDDINDDKVVEKLPEEEKIHINLILENYTPYSGVELEDMSHKEDPWINARKGYAPNERCEIEIDNDFLGNYFRERLSNGDG